MKKLKLRIKLQSSNYQNSAGSVKKWKKWMKLTLSTVFVIEKSIQGSRFCFVFSEISLQDQLSVDSYRTDGTCVVSVVDVHLL